MRLSGSEYMRFKNKILDLNRRLNDKIMLSSFEETVTGDTISEILKSPTLVRESIRVPNKFCKPHDRIRAVAAYFLEVLKICHRFE